MTRQDTFQIACLVGFGMGCGGAGSEPASATPAVTEGGEIQEAVRDEAWGQMGPDARMAFMQGTVLPEMKTLFQEFDGERYADFGCASCHGENMEEVGFSMPNGLAPLNPEQIPAMFASEDPMAQFMTQRVWPRMAELLQEPPYDPETQQGFSCLHCHATEGG